MTLPCTGWSPRIGSAYSLYAGLTSFALALLAIGISVPEFIRGFQYLTGRGDRSRRAVRAPAPSRANSARLRSKQERGREEGASMAGRVIGGMAGLFSFLLAPLLVLFRRRDEKDPDGPSLASRSKSTFRRRERQSAGDPEEPATSSSRKAAPASRAAAMPDIAEGGELAPPENFELPPLKFLALPKRRERFKVDEAEMAETAKALEKVLDDFGVRGDIVAVKPGPVITLYELEPAPGTRAARVIALADDIARSLCAMSVRVAVVPGRNVIGIELPNDQRETVYLSDLLSSEAYEKTSSGLGMALGKDISGEPVIVDLARMPHLLIAGTTGSGKSVRDQRDDPVPALSHAAIRVQIDHDRPQSHRAFGL